MQINHSESLEDFLNKVEEIIRHGGDGFKLTAIKLGLNIEEDFAFSDMSGMDLRNEDLSSVNLSGANLSGADLRGTLLMHTNMLGADLTGALIGSGTKVSSWRASWIIKSEVLADIRECFRSESALLLTLRSNPKTWAKISSGQPVRKATIKGILDQFMAFLDEYPDELIVSRNNHFFIQDVRAARQKYLGNGDRISWDSLAYESLS